MRVLLVSDFFPPVVGGLEFHADALASHLIRSGDDVAVATLTPNPQPSSAEVTTFTVRSSANALPHEQADRPFHPPITDPIARRHLRAVIDRFRPDIIHGHSWLTASVPANDIPTVFTAHDYALVCALRSLQQGGNDSCSGPELRKCIPCSAGFYGRAKGAAMALGTPVGRRRFPAVHIFAVSAAVSRALQPHIGVPMTVVSNFVGPEPKHEPLPDEIPAGDFVLFAGDARPHKGIPDLLQVWREQSPGIPLVIASPNAVQGALPAGVITVSLSRGQMAHAWSRASIAVAPSRWADPCPTVVLEAMRAGVPVIATDVGGIPDLVRPDVDGLLVPPRAPDQLGRAIRALADDAPARARLGASAALRTSAFTVEAVGDHLRREYARVLTK